MTTRAFFVSVQNRQFGTIRTIHLMYIPTYYHTEAIMTDFFPFIYEKMQKDPEPLPLYIELDMPAPEYKNPMLHEEMSERGCIIIQL